jgi:hypothetical protein
LDLTMLRILRAFAWLRWRVLMNSLERTGARDTLERLSLAAEQIGPLVAFGLMVPSAAGLALLGGYAGFTLPGSTRLLTFDAIRLMLALGTGFCILGPIMLPSMERTNAVRLLLLPIPRPTLYVAQASGALSDPWILLAIPLLVALPVGLAIAGAFAAAAVAVVANVLLIATLVGLSALAAFVLHLLVRDRRRGELITLVVILVLPLIGLLPSLLGSSGTRAERRAQRAARVERLARGEETRTERAVRVAGRAYLLLPSELATRAIHNSANGNLPGAVLPLAALAIAGAAFHAGGFAAFRRLLGSPGTSSKRQAVSDTSSRRTWIPGLSRAEAAVAQAQVRLALRTPRGRSLLVSPVIVLGMLSIMMIRQREVNFGALPLSGGLALATFGSTICLLAILPFAVNQFAIDRAGLTLAMLSPVGYRELLIGKAVGNGIIVGMPMLLCIVAALLLFRDGSPLMWASMVPAFLAIYATAAPPAAALSAMFPRSVDLNSIGRGSNAHGLAAFLGMLIIFAAAVPPAIITAIAVGMRMPALALPLMLGWCAIVLIVSRLSFAAVARVFDSRRENLGLVVR